MCKIEGTPNPEYGTIVLNFYLALAANGNKAAFEYVSGNLCGISARHIARLNAKLREASFVSLTKRDIVEQVTKLFSKIRLNWKDPKKRIALTVGIDATVVNKSWQLMPDRLVVVGGASPNHYIDVVEKIGKEQSDITKDDYKNLLKECTEGNHGVMAGEAKICVISIQGIYGGMCPFHAIAANPQTINDSNNFGSLCVEALKEAADSDGNSVILNQSTDGVTCEVDWNKQVTLLYLDGTINNISLTDPNHNVKNGRYQWIGGSSAAVMGFYVFNPSYLKLAGVPPYLWQIKDWESDAVLFQLCSYKTITKMMEYRYRYVVDTGNFAVSVVSLVFGRLLAYAVNANSVTWRQHDIHLVLILSDSRQHYAS